MANSRRKTRAQLESAKLLADRERIVTWAENFGAPTTLLVGWNPDDGTWDPRSPVGMMLSAIAQRGAHITTAASLVGIHGIGSLIAKGHEYMVEAAEQREYIPIDTRPFIDLARQIERAEALIETELVKTVSKAAANDPKMALAMLGRRFPKRWREQQTIFTAEQQDERDAVVSSVISNPDTALELAAIAHRIEDAANDHDPRE